ncbi:MAG: OsmC family protein [Acidobacteria bacterium]|nr:OsmC family protein [Acidobacteriota bacterium]
MGQDTHYYETRIEWAKRRRGNMGAEGLPDLAVSTPPEFKGEAGFWTPEHLFVASAESCLMATFLGIAENSRLAVTDYRSSAQGKLEWVDGIGYRFTTVTISPLVELEKAEDRELAARVMTKAAKGCLIARSMQLDMRVEPKFAVKAAVAA